MPAHRSRGWYAHTDTSAIEIRALSWNVFHGRSAPPDPALRTWRSRLLGTPERNATHIHVNRELLTEFGTLVAGADWDVALLQECPPRWSVALAEACGAAWHRSLTARNQLGGLRRPIAAWRPDLLGSWEGGSNLTLVRAGAGPIVERRDVRLRARPERRSAALVRLAGGLCVANLHASTNDVEASADIRMAAAAALELAEGGPVLLGGDFNVRPGAAVFVELAERHGFSLPEPGRGIDHLLARGLETVRTPRPWPPAAREVAEDGLALRLSDHAPVSATFAAR